MKRFIVERHDKFGNKEYLSSLSNDAYEFNTNLKNALIISENEKSLIRKISKKNYHSNPTFIPIKNFTLLGSRALDELHRYECDFMGSVLEYTRNEGELGKELIKAATEDERNIISYEEVSDKVAKLLIEKYNLKKKENYPW